MLGESVKNPGRQHFQFPVKCKHFQHIHNPISQGSAQSFTQMTHQAWLLSGLDLSYGEDALRHLAKLEMLFFASCAPSSPCQGWATLPCRADTLMPLPDTWLWIVTGPLREAVHPFEHFFRVATDGGDQTPALSSLPCQFNLICKCRACRGGNGGLDG